ncbi:MAG: glycosyltransferase family 4 protein [Chloroflexi bacterium]|nr:glycosyltransferase family 4 protein [Chloroflexota bacterium]
MSARRRVFRAIARLIPGVVRYQVLRNLELLIYRCLVFVVFPLFALLIRMGFRKPNPQPRVVFGAAPMINSKYHSQALRHAGVDSTTAVWWRQSWITTGDDFDVTLDPHQGNYRSVSVTLFKTPLTIARIFWKYDVFFYYFDGFYLLRDDKMKWRELQILKKLGKRIITMPYGGDITIAHESRELAVKYNLIRDYPFMAMPRYEDNIRRQVRYFTQHSDAIIGALHLGPDHLPRIDYLLRCHFAIDEGAWTPSYGPQRQVGDPFRVLHAPNHRHQKGTRFLIEAVERLKAEGLNIELVLLERVPNAEVKRLMAECHVVADQFVLGWYALTAVEAMASGKPVLTYLRDDLVRLYDLYSYEQGCPIINTPIERIAERLRWLYYHPEECERIGRESRAYVERYHSLEGFGGFLKGVVDQVWSGAPFNVEEYWRSRGQAPIPADSSSTHRKSALEKARQA